MANQHLGFPHISLFTADFLRSKKKKINSLNKNDSVLTNDQSNAISNPTVDTDKEDYQPGETAYITASDFTPGETIEFQVLHLAPGADGLFGTQDDITIQTSGDGHEPWRVKDGGKFDLDGKKNGSVLTTWYVNPDDSADATFNLTAKGLSSDTFATNIFTDSVTLNLTKPNVQSQGKVNDTLGNQLLFAWTNFPGGSGNSNPFLRVRTSQGSTTEKGYNTDGTKEFDTQSQGTKAIRLSNLPKIRIDNVDYYEFRIDLNESNSNPQISLTKLQIFQSNVGNLTGYDTNTGKLAGLNPKINFNGSVLMDASLNSGSGVGDTLVYLPANLFSGNPYLYFYVEFQGADSGFEELSYRKTTNTVKELADLSLSQTISSTLLSVGNQVSFTLTLNNAGPNKATGVQVKDLLPSGFSFVSATPSLGTYDSKTGIWKVDSINSGSNATLILTGKVLDAASTSAYTNVAEIIAAKPLDPDSTVNNGNPTEDDYSSLTASVAKLNLSKKFTSVTQEVDVNNDGKIDQLLALPGDNVSFQIQVTNNGSTNATNVKILDDLTQVLPIGLTVQSLSLDGGINLDTAGGGDGNLQTVEVLFNSIAPGATKTITVNAKVSTDYIKPFNFSGELGTIDPDTRNINPELPEYYNMPFNGTFFLHYNVEKAIGEDSASFGYLNITNKAEIAAVNGTNLNPGAITASARLDVSTYKISGTLNNGQEFRMFSIENLLQPNISEGSFFFNPDPDVGTIPSAIPYYNLSEFLPPGETGSAGFFGSWIKTNNPQYLADLAAWSQLGSDGNFSKKYDATASDEKAVVDALAKFIEDGVYSRDRFASGYFTFNNGTQTEKLTFNAGQFTPGTTSNVNILVTDIGATVTNSNGNSLGSFANLQAALDSFNFVNSTGVNVTIQDSSIDGVVQTRLQKLQSYNFEKNWSIQNITIASNVKQAIFASGNGAANIDLSNVNIVNSSSKFILRGDNAGDKITGSRFNDVIEGFNGNDILSGFDGNDVINGGNGSDILTGGRGNDTLTGGLGADEFVFGAKFGNDTITDFKSLDKINVEQLSLTRGVLDSNSDALLNANDNFASLINGNLKLDLTSLNGGTITFTGVTSVNMAAFIL